MESYYFTLLFIHVCSAMCHACIQFIIYNLSTTLQNSVLYHDDFTELVLPSTESRKSYIETHLFRTPEILELSSVLFSPFFFSFYFFAYHYFFFLSLKDIESRPKTIIIKHFINIILFKWKKVIIHSDKSCHDSVLKIVLLF